MNRILVIIVCLICMGCTSQAKEANSPYLNIAYRDSLNILKQKNLENSHKLDSLMFTLESVSNRCLKLEKSEKENGASIDYIAYGLISLLFIVSIFYLYKFYKISEIKDLLYRKIQKNKKEIEAVIDSMNNRNTLNFKDNSRQSDVLKLERKIDELELRINNIYRFLNKKTDLINNTSFSSESKRMESESQKEIVDKTSSQKNVKEAYFGMVKGEGFFNDVYTVNKDESLFKIRYYSDTEVSFVPLELEKIRFIDDIEKAVIFTGDVSLNDAVSFEIANVGKAVKNGAVWNIKDKVEIILK